MASLKEIRARARKHGLAIREYKVPVQGKYRYRLFEGFNAIYWARNVKDLGSGLSHAIRQRQKSEMVSKLNGHRPKYGYKTVPRKRRRNV